MVPVPLVVSVPPLPKLPATLTVLAPVEVNWARAAVPLNVIEPGVGIVPVLPLVLAASVMVAAAALAVTVTVWELAMVTLSPATGETPPTHVVPTSQLPLWAEVMLAARAPAPASRPSREEKPARRSFL